MKKDPRVHNASAVQDWAQRCAACVAAQGYDGILLDMETIGGPPIGPVSERTLGCVKLSDHACADRPANPERATGRSRRLCAS